MTFIQLVYEIDYPPEFNDVTQTKEELERVVYDTQNIEKVKKFYVALNTENNFPSVPTCYKEWKEKFKKLVFLELKTITS